MNIKLINLDPNFVTKTKSNWEINLNLFLEQDRYITEIITQYKPKTIETNYFRWEKYCSMFDINGDTKLMLYAHLHWATLSSLIETIEKIQTDYILIAVNKYLILQENQLDDSLPENYDQAIFQFCSKKLKKLAIIDYQYHAQENGNIGNFISPDNRLLCKKKM